MPTIAIGSIGLIAYAPRPATRSPALLLEPVRRATRTVGYWNISMMERSSVEHGPELGLDLDDQAASGRPGRRSCRHPDLVDAEHGPPDRRDAALDLGPGGHEGACKSARCLRSRQRAAGPPCRSASAAGSSATANADGTMYSGSRGAGEGTQLADRRHGRHRAGRRTRPAAGRPGESSRATTTRLRTAGCLASTASISPSSMRKPRILTWWSRRPRNSMRAVGPIPHEVAGPVQPRAPRQPGTVGHEALGRQLRPVADSRARRRRRRCTARRARRSAPARHERRARRAACWRSAGRSAPAARGPAIRWSVDQIVVSVGP